MADTIEGTIRKVISHKPSAWSATGIPYLIAVLDTGDKVKGEMLRPINGQLVGERCRFYGEVRPDKQYGPAFCFDHHEPVIDPSARGVVDYLTRHVESVGQSRARKIFDTFGGDTIHVLRTDPERLSEIEDLPEPVIRNITEHFATLLEFDPAAYCRLVDLLAQYKVSRKLIRLLLKDWGSDAPEKVHSDPYMLLSYPGVGWDTVDSVATEIGHPRDSLSRHCAGALESLQRIIDQGHTIASRIDVKVGTNVLLRMALRPDTWDALDDSGRVVVLDADPENPESGFVTTPRLEYAERYIAERIAQIRQHAPEIGVDSIIPVLTPDQQRAVTTFFEAGFLILSGPPGTGKSWTFSRIVEKLMKSGLSIRVMAPTGKAAKRAEELIRQAIGDRASRVPCTTIHRALGIGPSDEDEGVPSASARAGRGRKQFGFRHGETNPIPANVFIIDEFSMVDASLFASLLAAIPLGAIVLLVGDADQLPSVGPGSVLRDLIDSGIPSVSLTNILRSDGGGRVVRACHAIRDGRSPEPAPRFEPPTENWVHIEAEDPEQIAATIVDRIRKIKTHSKMGLDPMEDVQVISAQYKKPMGCENLNRLLSDLLNPSESSPDDSQRIRKGDKVIRRKNASVDGMIPAEYGMDSNWKWEHPDYPDTPRWSFAGTAVVNGDMGRVLDIVVAERNIWAVVRFKNPDRLVRLPLGSSHLEQAYAITCHSGQGSGFPLVIVPVHDSFYFDSSTNTGLWCRELLYTAISRAEQVLITVGPFEAIRTAIRRRTIGNRRTWLPRRIAEVAARPPRPETQDFDYEDESEPYRAETVPDFDVEDI